MYRIGNKKIRKVFGMLNGLFKSASKIGNIIETFLVNLRIISKNDLDKIEI